MKIIGEVDMLNTEACPRTTSLVADAEENAGGPDEVQEDTDVVLFAPFETLTQREKRALVIRLLYIAESSDYQDSVQAIIDNVNRGFNVNIPFDSNVARTCAAIVEHRNTLDQTFLPFLANWRLDRVSVMTKLILRFGTWEILEKKQDPRIIINEAVELAKFFGEQDSYKFVNGVLDKLAKSITESTS
jgi:transcription antitermination protein NusB